MVKLDLTRDFWPRNFWPLKSMSLFFKVINTLLITAIILVILLIARDALLRISGKPYKQDSPKAAAQQAKSTGTKDLEVILKNNPFSNQSGTFTPITSHDSATQTTSDLKLVGTISGDRRYSFAVFADKEGRQEMIRLGNPVGAIGTLRQVYSDKVVIGKEGRQTEIAIAEIVKIEEAQIAYQAQSAKATDFARQTGERSFVVDQKRIQHAIDNPNQIMTDARLLPNIVEGVQRGFVLREVRQGGIYQSLGLRDGDVLLRINEYNINNPENGLQAFMALKGLERVNLDIIRGGANLTLTYLIK